MRRFAGHIFAVLCLLLVLTGCREVATYEDPKCHLTVTVRDQKNESVSGCSITVTAIGGDQGARTLVSGMDGEQYFDLAPGDYPVPAGKDEFFPADPVRVHLSDPEQRLTIVLNRRPAYITCEPDVLDFGNQESINDRTFKILNKSWEDLEWAVAEIHCPWIVSVSPSNGILKRDETASIKVVIDRDGLKPGEDQTYVSVVSLNGKGSSEVLIKATGRDRPAFLTVDPEVLAFGDEASITRRSFKLMNDTGKDQEWYLSAHECPWIRSVTPSDGTLKKNLSTTVEVVIDRGRLQGGDNETILTVASPSGGGSVEVRIQAVGEEKWAPVVNVKDATSVDRTKAVLNGEIIDAGSPAYHRRGFSYSTRKDGADATLVYAGLDGSSSFSAGISGLTPGTTYYVKAFATDQGGTPTWSTNQVSFTTVREYPSVRTDAVSDIDVVSNTCVFHGTVLSAGSPVYSEKGFCYNTSGEPTVADSRVSVPGTASGAFQSPCSLGRHATFYVRAYVIQPGMAPVYGSTVSFNTNPVSTRVTSYAATDVTGTSATLNGSILETGVPNYTERGFCYTEGYSTPSITSSTKVTCGGTGAGDFSRTIQVDYDTYYTFRAYALQDGSPVYGETLHFQSGYTQPKVRTLDVSGQDYDSVTLNAEITERGDPEITECGFCYINYDDTYSYPTVTTGKTVRATIGNTYSAVLDNSELEGAVRYCYRSYVIQDGKAYYGEARFFTAFIKPGVLTGDVIEAKKVDSSVWTVTFQGACSDKAVPQINVLGFVYGTSHNPTIEDKVGGITTTSYQHNDTYGAYVFTGTSNNVPANKTYYCRAFIKTSLGVFYSNNEVTFSTY